MRIACLAVLQPGQPAARRFLCLGPAAHTVPARMSWDQFPMLPAAIFKRQAVFLSDPRLLPKTCTWPDKDFGGCIAFPIPAESPAAVLFLSYAGTELPDPGKWGTLPALVEGLRGYVENARLRNQLTISEMRYRSILTAAPFLIALLDGEGNVLEVNSKSLRELRRQGVSGRRAWRINLAKSPAIPEEIRNLVTDSLRRGEALSREKISILLPRGTEILRVHTLPLRSPAAPAGELLLIGEVITHYHQLMGEAERSERLAAVGRVAASLAHEINNPLQALRSHLELIRAYPLSEAEREQSFRILEREVERLDETTRRVLGFARPAPDVLQAVAITAVIEQALALSRNYLHNQQVEILTEFPEPIPPVMAAAGQLIQVFLNIILNASHAMQGKGRLEVRARALAREVEITFTNNGPPIPAENLARIFDPFYTTREDGTGLGLSISHAILQRHRGTIRAVNLPHRKGVAFVITLPFASRTAPKG